MIYAEKLGVYRLVGRCRMSKKKALIMIIVQLGSTLDDNIGEAFDKVARMLKY